MKDNQSSRKYQVYFFLYLAVICELLIIIVERDDAERDLMLRQREQERLIQLVIAEYIETMPVAQTNGNNQMKVGETKTFTLEIRGVGEHDQITEPPSVQVLRDGVVVRQFKAGDGLREVDSARDGSRIYVFDWKAPSTGRYMFAGSTGTDRISARGGMIKLGGLLFPIEQIKRYVLNIEDIINASEHITDSLYVDVIAQGDQLRLFGTDITTAAGFPGHATIEVQGTDARHVRISPTSGEVLLRNGQLHWQGTFSKPGTYAVQLRGSDNRGAGAFSRASASFNVTVVAPESRSRTRYAYAGELFQKNLAVGGLEDRTRYSWKATLDGNTIISGDGAMAEFMIPEDADGSRLELSALFDGRVYPVNTDSVSTADSRFTYTVASRPVRFRNLSFSQMHDYPVNQEFRFEVYRCGRCIRQNMTPPERVNVVVDGETGDDLLDTFEQEAIIGSDGRTVGMRVRFYLRGKVDKGGEEAEITLRADGQTKRVRVILFPD